MKNKAQPDGMPVWFDGKSINEALFCEEFLQTHKIIFTNGAFFTPEGRVTDELPLRGEIFEELKCCAVSNIPRKISNIMELMKLAALVEDFPPEPDRIHLANGTLFLDGTFEEGKPIPAVERMYNLMKKYQVAFTETTMENKKLKQKNAQLEQSLEKATQESTLKQLADAKLRRDYADAVAVLDRIPKEVLDVYTRGSGRKERPIEQNL